jgi:hypothetical protein
MTSRSGTIRFEAWATVARAGVGACALFVALSALAQDAPNPSPSPGQNPSTLGSDPSSSPPAPNVAPGFVDAMGRWLEEGATKFKSDLQGAQERFDQLGTQTREAAKDATGAVIALPNARILAARERCAIAQNGGPDCQTAALTLCQGKGFQTGKSLDTQSERKCPARLLLERRAPNDTECPTETFVTRAVCQ